MIEQFVSGDKKFFIELPHTPYVIWFRVEKRNKNTIRIVMNGAERFTLEIKVDRGYSTEYIVLTKKETGVDDKIAVHADSNVTYYFGKPCE